MIKGFYLCTNYITQTRMYKHTNCFELLEDEGVGPHFFASIDGITTLDLSCNDHVNVDGGIAFGSYLKQNTSLVNLDLYATQIGDNGVTAIAKGLYSNAALKNLNLGANQIGDLCGIDIGIALYINSTLTVLNLTNNKIQCNGAVTIAAALCTNDTLITLLLNNNCIGNKGAIAFGAALKKNGTLSIIHLSNNRIGVPGGVAIGEAMQSNVALTSLVLANNCIGNDGAISIGTAIRTNSTLVRLDLYNNKIEAEGGKIIATAMFTNHSISYLDVGENKIGGLAIAYCFSNWLANSFCHLTTFNGSGNNLGDAIGHDLGALLSNNNIQLNTLVLSKNNIGNEGVKAIFKALSVNTTLKTLFLCHNNIENEGAYAIGEALLTNNTLTHLFLSFNSGIGVDGYIAIVSSLCRNVSLGTLDMLSWGYIADKRLTQAVESVLFLNTTITSFRFSAMDCPKFKRILDGRFWSPRSNTSAAEACQVAVLSCLFCQLNFPVYLPMEIWYFIFSFWKRASFDSAP